MSQGVKGVTKHNFSVVIIDNFIFGCVSYKIMAQLSSPKYFERPE